VSLLVAPEAAATARSGAAAAAATTSTTAATTTATANTTAAHSGGGGIAITGGRRRPLHAIHCRRGRRVRISVAGSAGTTVGTPIRCLRLRIRVGVLCSLLLLTIRSAHAPLRASRRRRRRRRRRRSGRMRVGPLATASVRTITRNVATA